MKYIIWQRFALFLFISTIEVTLIHIFKMETVCSLQKTQCTNLFQL